MNRKILALMAAAVMAFSMTATALAAPDDTPAPSGSPAPASTAPAGSGSDFVKQVKALSEKVTALRKELAGERQYDRQIQQGIKGIQGIVKADKAKVKEFRKELNALDKKIKKLQNQLRKEQAKRRNRDQATIDDLKAQIQAAKDERAALIAKYQPLIDQIHGNAAGRRSLKPLREELRPKYAELRPLFQASARFQRDISSLISSLKDAIKAGDELKASDLISQINAKISQLEDNLNQRIAIREEMKKMLDDYKAGLVKVS